MSPVLEITVPTALPAASSVDPCIAAITETVISGNVVAMLTMVAPIMKAGIPAALVIQLGGVYKPVASFSDQKYTGNEQNSSG